VIKRVEVDTTVYQIHLIRTKYDRHNEIAKRPVLNKMLSYNNNIYLQTIFVNIILKKLKQSSSMEVNNHY